MKEKTNMARLFICLVSILVASQAQAWFGSDNDVLACPSVGIINAKGIKGEISIEILSSKANAYTFKGTKYRSLIGGFDGAAVYGQRYVCYYFDGSEYFLMESKVPNGSKYNNIFGDDGACSSFLDDCAIVLGQEGDEG